MGIKDGVQKKKKKNPVKLLSVQCSFHSSDNVKVCICACVHTHIRVHLPVHTYLEPDDIYLPLLYFMSLGLSLNLGLSLEWTGWPGSSQPCSAHLFP